MDWISKEDSLPKADTQVLVFSPVYQENDNMRFRIMGGQFVRICTEATHWAYLEAPNQLEN
jgi:hypothetical protein